MLKKIGAVTLAGAVAFSLSACGEKEEVAKNISNNTKEEKSSEKKESTKKEDTREYNVEKTTQIRDQKITVHKVQIAQVAEYDKLEKGNEFVIVHVTVENIGNQKLRINPLDFYLERGDGSIVDHTFSTSNKNIFKIKDVDPNGKLTGAITFEAKKGDSNLQLIYRPDVMSKEQVKVELK
ncbi:DUF4352 domain-containing protein [Bacillus thuringiensis]|uniref:DUF4352 domain-containing protein n=1 Tax=Bacillus thuringiensis TaxID=1428 RepID=UPI003F6AA753